MSRPRAIPDNELALAYELRQEGCCWKRIAQGLGVDYEVLRNTVKNMLRDGLRDMRIEAPDWAVTAAATMRANGLGWLSISAHLGIDMGVLQRRYYKTAKSRSEKAKG